MNPVVTLLLIMVGFILAGAVIFCILQLLDQRQNQVPGTQAPPTPAPQQQQSQAQPQQPAQSNDFVDKLLAFLKKHWIWFAVLVAVILLFIFPSFGKEIAYAVFMYALVAYAVAWLIKACTKKKPKWADKALLIGIIAIIAYALLGKL